VPRKNYEGLVQRIEDSDGVYRCTMEQVRNAHGMSKLGVRMIKDIEGELQRRGVAHVPRELPHDSQDRLVVLYMKSSEIGEVIDAARRGSMTNRDFKVLRNAAQALADSEKFDQVRRIVNDD